MSINSSYVRPPFRKLRAYAFDPSLSLAVDTVTVNTITYRVEWENLDFYSAEKNRTVPSGDYIEIIDIDPASGVLYDPVDLDHPHLLAQDGLQPDVGDPRFHQQMVYAVIMVTIKNFEQALGRKIQWSDRRLPADARIRNHYVQKLRVYPHALRRANAYYHPAKKALLFGYFPSRTGDARLQVPGSTVFTCLSHDIIAHETTHALLDGMYSQYIQPTHPDTRAFHEAFADIVALFQHFSFPEVLKHQIARTKGDLASQNLLGQLAQEFGKAIGGYGSLRDAIGGIDPATGQWQPHQPDPSEYDTILEFHARGSILVAAVFEAFLTIYKSRIRKLLRVATGGTGKLADGDIHPDLVDLLAETAASTAQRILKICVRALDYCPPLDINFGDYLRALITADVDLVKDDVHNYRIAFVEAFQRRGIFPEGIKTMSVEALRYTELPAMNQLKINEALFGEFLKSFKDDVGYLTDRREIYEKTKKYIAGSEDTKAGLHHRIISKLLEKISVEDLLQLTGLYFGGTPADCRKNGFNYSSRSKSAAYWVDHMWLASRISPDDKIVNHVVITLTQQRGVKCQLDENDHFSIKGYAPPVAEAKEDLYRFNGGCTLIFDLDNMRLKYVIKKGIDDKARLENQFRYCYGNSMQDDHTYFSENILAGLAGPFAFMHSH